MFGWISPEVVNTTVAPIDEAPQALHEHLSAAAVKTILVAEGAAGL
jgi:hypothetical protein